MKYVLFLCSLFFSISLNADIVELKEDGTVYDDVKTFVAKDFIEIRTKDGKLIQVNKKNIKKIKFEPVRWKKEKVATNDELLRVMQESLHYSEMLQEDINNTKLEIEKMRDEIKAISVVAEKAHESASKSLQLHWMSAGKSVLIPGWGQSDGFEVKGFVILGLYAVANYASSRTYQSYQTAVEKYNSNYITPYLILTSEYGDYSPILFPYFTAERKSLKKVNRTHRMVLGVTGAILLYSIVDALFFMPPKMDKIPQEKESSFHWDFSVEPVYHKIDQIENHYQLQMYWSF